MAVQRVFVVALVALLAAGAWRVVNSGALGRWLHPPPAALKAVVFDNGTVRNSSSAPAAASAAAVTPPIAIGVARKCRQGPKVTYTDMPCAEGALEQAIGGRVSVLDGRPVGKPPPMPAPTDKPRASLIEALDESGNQNLREKRIERAVNR